MVSLLVIIVLNKVIWKNKYNIITICGKANSYVAKNRIPGALFPVSTKTVFRRTFMSPENRKTTAFGFSRVNFWKNRASVFPEMSESKNWKTRKTQGGIIEKLESGFPFEFFRDFVISSDRDERRHSFGELENHVLLCFPDSCFSVIGIGLIQILQISTVIAL